MDGISITKLLVVTALIILVFDARESRTLDGDLGSAIKGFKKAVGEDDGSMKKTTVEEEAPTQKIPHRE